MIVNRENELNLLKEILRNSENTVVLINGAPGMGKTSLARYYAQIYKKNYSNVVFWNANDIPQDKKLPSKTLLLIDEADDLGAITIEEVRKVNRKINIIVIGRNIGKLGSENKEYHIINLNSLTKEEMLYTFKYYTNATVNIPDHLIHYFDFLQGNPSLLYMYIELINKLKLTSVDKLIYESTIISNEDILLPEKKIEIPSIINIKSDVASINEQLMKYIAENPSYMYELSSREFEEMMATLFAKLGYSVELTQRTRDGGKDIYIAKKNEIGHFLFLVECKKYSPDNPVGVDVVRNLYGVMGMEDKKPTGGIIATTSYFTRDAEQIVEKKLEHQISLHDYEYISKLLKKAYL